MKNKKTIVSKYLADARNAAHNDFAHADGGFGDNGAFAKDAWNATGASSAAVQTSQPYLINVTSTSAAAVANFPILGSNEYLYSSGFNGNGDLVVGSVTISSGMPGISYRQMLAQFQTNPFTVGKTYYQSATANQILQSIQVSKKDANGNTATRPMIPAIDPYQQQANVLVMNDRFDVDGNTSLVINQILPNATVQFQIYPLANINLARGLESAAVSKEFSDPGIVKAQKVVLS